MGGHSLLHGDVPAWDPVGVAPLAALLLLAMPLPQAVPLAHLQQLSLGNNLILAVTPSTLLKM